MNSIDRKNDLLRQLKGKEISFDVFLRQIGEWACEDNCWYDYEVRQYPNEPKELQEYNSLPLDKRLKIPPEFFYQPSIREYSRMRSKVYAENWADYNWLKDVKSWLPDDPGHLELTIKLDTKIFEFKMWFEHSNPQLERVRNVFGGEVMNG